MNMRHVIIAAFATFALAGCGGSKSGSSAIAQEMAIPTLATNVGAKVLYYRNPMNAAVTSPVPAKDNMGMDYIPVYADHAGSTIKVSPSVVNNLGIRTALAEQGPLPREIDTVGYVDYNKALTTRLHTRAEGWVQNLVIKSAGERIDQGELLFTLYAPKLATAEQEYLHALDAGNPDLAAASRQRLSALGVSDEQTKKLADTRKADAYIPYYAGQGGVVQELDVRPGQYVTPDTQLMQLAGVASVWVSAEVFEKQADWVGVGDEAELTLTALPGKVLKGKVDFVAPSLDTVTRSLEVRLRFDNPGELLKPGMYADARIHATPVANAISVPAEALIRTADGDRVVIALSGGAFDVRQVSTGIESGDRVQILSGVKAGERVVASGQFLLDSEESLRGGLERLSGGAP